jgi:hypothetical protein
MPTIPVSRYTPQPPTLGLQEADPLRDLNQAHRLLGYAEFVNFRFDNRPQLLPCLGHHEIGSPFRETEQQKVHPSLGILELDNLSHLRFDKSISTTNALPINRTVVPFWFIQEENELDAAAAVGKALS